MLPFVRIGPKVTQRRSFKVLCYNSRTHRPFSKAPKFNCTTTKVDEKMYTLERKG